MKPHTRIPAAQALVTLLLLLWAFSPGAWAALERQPYLQNVTDSQVVLRWRTTSPSDSLVRYGLSPDNLPQSVSGNDSVSDHEITITGLAADTRYYYSVGSSTVTEAGGDDQHYFRTAPTPGTERAIRIWAIGDAGTGRQSQFDVRDAYYHLDDVDTDVVLALGDNAYSNGTDQDYTERFFSVYEDLFRHAPVWSALGNHERNAGVYAKAFTHPAHGEGGGLASGSELYYSFDYGNIHFIALNSFTGENDDAMYQWLENDLKSTLQKWIIAFWHHPPYSRSSAHDSDYESGQRILRERANPILERYGVDLQLSGHNHFYSRTVLINGHYGRSSTYDAAQHAIDAGDGKESGDGAYDKGSNPEGAVYVLAGSSGKVGYTIYHHPANFIEAGVLGSLVIDVNGNRMAVRMLRENGSIEDAFTLIKSDDSGNGSEGGTGIGNGKDSDSGEGAGALGHGLLLALAGLLLWRRG